MNIIIPLGGIGHRFAVDGYRFPKPLVKIVGRPMLFWLIDHLETDPDDIIYIGVGEAIEQQFGLLEMLRTEYPQKTFQGVVLGFHTRGAAETLFIILQSMSVDRLSRKTISLDCDTIYFKPIIKQFREMPPEINASFYFIDNGEKPIYSYLLLESNENLEKLNQRVLDVSEKIMISKYANTGAYAFASGTILKTYCNTVLDQAVGVAGEYYTTSVIKSMLNDQQPFIGIHVSFNDFVCVGTPNQLNEFLMKLKSKEILQQKTNSNIITNFRQMRFCFDLDNTLVSYPMVHGDYNTIKPKIQNIRLLRELYKAGHYIIIQTARRMKTHAGNVGAVVADIGCITLDTLKKFDIPYHEILFGKPYADVYVDDLGVNALIDTVKEIGWCLEDIHMEENINKCHTKLEKITNGTLKASPNKREFVPPRHFNTIQELGKMIIKSGPKENLDGEIFFYENVPESIRNLFPQLENVIRGKEKDGNFLRSSIVLERIEGVTYSHLLTNFCLTPGRLIKLLINLKRLHEMQLKQEQTEENANIYANYSEKLRSRYKQYIGIYENAEQHLLQDSDAENSYVSCETLMTNLLEFFDEYQKNKRGLHSWLIHGDPVFTNVLLTADNQIKFLDMRGSLGNHLTLQGDVNYDLSKVYQSLTGYDFILHNKSYLMIDEDLAPYQRYIGELRDLFIQFITTEYTNIKFQDIHMITIQMYLSLIPLHDSLQHQIEFLKTAIILHADSQRFNQ